MGLFGIIIASVVNIFLQSSALQFAISLIGVLVFAGLTAYDTQRIKDTYYEVTVSVSSDRQGRLHGALNLYLDFINSSEAVAPVRKALVAGSGRTSSTSARRALRLSGSRDEGVVDAIGQSGTCA